MKIEELTLKLNGEIIEPWFIKACCDRVGNFPTPYGWMTMSYLTERIEYLKEQRKITPIVEIVDYIDRTVEVMKAIKAYLEKE